VSASICIEFKYFKQVFVTTLETRKRGSGGVRVKIEGEVMGGERVNLKSVELGPATRMKVMVIKQV